MRTKKLAGFCLTVVTGLSIFLLIYSLSADIDARDQQIISSEENFRELINTDNSFLLFYLRGDGDQSDLLHTWNSLAKTVSTDYKGIHVAKFDCSVYRPICEGIGAGPNFPSLVWMQHGKIVDHYQGYLEIESLKTYVFDKTRSIALNDIESNESDVKSYENEDDIIASDEIDDDKENKIDSDGIVPNVAIPVNSVEASDDVSSSSLETDNKKDIDSTETDEETSSSGERSDFVENNDAFKFDSLSSFDEETSESEDDDIPDTKSNEAIKDNVEEVQIKQMNEKPIEVATEALNKAQNRIPLRKPNRVPLPAEETVKETDDGRLLKIIRGNRMQSLKDRNKDTKIIEQDKDTDVEDTSESASSLSFKPVPRERNEQVIVIGGDTDEEEVDSSELLKPKEPNVVDIGGLMAQKPKDHKHSEELERKLNLKVQLPEKKTLKEVSYLKLSEDNFSNLLNPVGVTLVMFYSDTEDSIELRKTLKSILSNHKGTQIRIGEVNCGDNEDLCAEQGVTRDPQLNLYRRRNRIVDDFQGRTYEKIDDFLLSSVKFNSLINFNNNNENIEPRMNNVEKGKVEDDVVKFEEVGEMGAIKMKEKEEETDGNLEDLEDLAVIDKNVAKENEKESVDEEDDEDDKDTDENLEMRDDDDDVEAF